MINRKSLEVWVGLFVAAGILALAMLAFKVGNLTSADVMNSYKVTGRFDNVGGLKVTAAGTIGGARRGWPRCPQGRERAPARASAPTPSPAPSRRPPDRPSTPPSGQRPRRREPKE